MKSVLVGLLMASMTSVYAESNELKRYNKIKTQICRAVNKQMTKKFTALSRAADRVLDEEEIIEVTKSMRKFRDLKSNFERACKHVINND